MVDRAQLVEKEFLLDRDHILSLREQPCYTPGEEGLRVWECGIVMSR